ncbi:hypothetical protein C2G38_2032714 [Gigaspora rosea]|uniref:Uncharacterized protein n=1 Tax=Gigaspora rosea TaxID=44941 RepID=A0A397VM06_9GLOM|nr:hypothetical protein C2G38_2032714 [Gigaspora rosea]CAG8604609.1 8403_t:CDS:1 [Gigaspora rosea]
MNRCSFCGHHYPPESFIHKGKTNKTCSNCLISKAEKRRKLENNKTETTIKTSHTLCDYVAKLISNAKNTNEISFEIRIDLNNNMFSMATFNNLKSIVRLIVDKIEEGDDYVWSATTAPHISVQFSNVATYYFTCSQCYELEREYKQSNRKRIVRFDCYGKLTLHIDVPAMEAIIKLHHNILHEKPENVSTPEKIKQQIFI